MGYSLVKVKKTCLCKIGEVENVSKTAANWVPVTNLKYI